MASALLTNERGCVVPEHDGDAVRYNRPMITDLWWVAYPESAGDFNSQSTKTHFPRSDSLIEWQVP